MAPVFFIGVTLVLRSDKSLKLRIMTVLIPIFLWLPSTYLFHRIYNYHIPQIYLIPKEFSGRLRIILKKNCGKKSEVKNGRKLLKFSSSRIAVLDENYDPRGHGDREFFLIDEKGILTKLKEIQSEEVKKNNLPAIKTSGVQSIRIYEPVFNEIYYYDLFLYDNNYNSKDNFMISKEYLDSITKEIVRKCNKN